jgi:hypothetical protein
LPDIARAYVLKSRETRRASLSTLGAMHIIPTADTRRSDAAILLAAITTWAIVMSFHPVHSAQPPILWRFAISDLVHGVALFVKPLLLYGFWRLSRLLGADRHLVGIALCFYALGDVAMLCAGTVSGWITPAVVDQVRASPELDQSMWASLGRLSVWMNRGFANVNVLLTSVAYLLWALALPGRSAAALLLRTAGVVSGGVVLIWQAAGTFEPSPSNMMLVAVGQSSWVVLVALAMGWTHIFSKEAVNA